MYRTLDPDKIIATLEALCRRIGERFPGAGLGKVAIDLLDVAREAQTRADKISQPYRGLRILIALMLASAAVLMLAFVWQYLKNKSTESTDLYAVLQGLDAGANLALVIGAAIWTTATLETRFKRRLALADLHQLRSIIHVIDMHQLTKDPSDVLGQLPNTRSSPKRILAPIELMRYLDYCSEMLSLSSKVAAIYAQHLRDPVVISTVNEIEQLTTNLSNKIWQKISILERSDPEAVRTEISTIRG